uniref:Uncharacterized protein n=1 Tax=Eutreptiella gymnastica TaxID=73025 RepID=A0A7S4LB89_9EUGL
MSVSGGGQETRLLPTDNTPLLRPDRPGQFTEGREGLVLACKEAVVTEQQMQQNIAAELSWDMRVRNGGGGTASSTRQELSSITTRQHTTTVRVQITEVCVIFF